MPALEDDLVYVATRNRVVFGSGDLAGLPGVAGLFLLALVAESALLFLQGYLVQAVGQRIMADLRRDDHRRVEHGVPDRLMEHRVGGERGDLGLQVSDVVVWWSSADLLPPGRCRSAASGRLIATTTRSGSAVRAWWAGIHARSPSSNRPACAAAASAASTVPVPKRAPPGPS